MSPATTRCLAVLVALAAAAAPAAAQKKGAGRGPLECARSEIGELRYEDARKTVEKAIRSGTNGPEEMVELYLLLGEVKASLGDDDAAETAFSKALIIDPAGKGYVVKQGMAIGINNGVITRITPSFIEVAERYRDDTGRMTKRTVKLSLPKKQ